MNFMSIITTDTPSRRQRLALRRLMLDISARKQKPGAGSNLQSLMKERQITMKWWQEVVLLLQKNGLTTAVAGGVGANSYMPPRQTSGLDLVVTISDLDKAALVLKKAAWNFIGMINLEHGLEGTGWKQGHNELGLLGLPGIWGQEALNEAQENFLVAKLPTISLNYLVIMKLISARAQDSADIIRMLGAAPETEIEIVRQTVSRWLPNDQEDFEQMVLFGKLEYQ
jgi:hypothetical protein